MRFFAAPIAVHHAPPPARRNATVAATVTEDAEVPASAIASLKSWMERIYTVHLERYADPESVEGAYWDLARAAAEAMGDTLDCDPSDYTFCGMGEDGKEVEYTQADALEGMRQMGVWGFCDTTSDPPAVHYWASDDTRSSALLTFFSHEFSHAVLQPLLQSGPVNEEVLAEVCSGIACRAYRLGIGMEEQPEPGFIPTKEPDAETETRCVPDN